MSGNGGPYIQGTGRSAFGFIYRRWGLYIVVALGLLQQWRIPTPPYTRRIGYRREPRLSDSTLVACRFDNGNSAILWAIASPDHTLTRPPGAPPPFADVACWPVGDIPISARSELGVQRASSHEDALLGGIGGIVLSFGSFSGSSRNAAGYLSAFTFSSGSDDLQA